MKILAITILLLLTIVLSNPSASKQAFAQSGDLNLSQEQFFEEENRLREDEDSTGKVIAFFAKAGGAIFLLLAVYFIHRISKNSNNSSL